MSALCEACRAQPARIEVVVLETLPDGERTRVAVAWCHTCCPTELVGELHLRGERVVGSGS